MENFAGKNDNSKLKGYLDTVLEVSLKKFNKEKARNRCRQAWGRLIVQAVKAYGELIKNEEIEELRDEIDLIKTEMNLT